MIKKGSHLDGVEPINEKNIDKGIVLKILSSKLNKTSAAYKYIEKLIKNKKICDKSGYSGNSVIIMKSVDETEDYVLKISKNHELKHEFISYQFFYKLNYTSKPLAYFDCGEYEVLIVEKINLLTAGNYFNSYKEIAEFFGKKLKEFHEQKLINYIGSDLEKELFSKKYKDNLNKALSNNFVLKYLAEYLNYSNIDEMKKYIINNQSVLYKNLVVVHGDFNPNNVFVDNDMNIKIIDFCDTGLCNKHYDIFWTLFMLIIFSGILKEPNKIKECEEIFYNSYGIENINFEEIKFFKYFTSLYWKEHDEITRIDIL